MRSIAALWAVPFGLLAGCAGPQVVQLYDGPQRDVKEIAVLRAVQHGATAAGFAYVTSVDSMDSKTKPRPVDESFADHYPSELRVLPGRYEIRLQCHRRAPSKAGNLALPATTLNVGAGFTYELHCDPSNSNPRKVSVKFRRYATSERAPLGD
jgi:hypothetical protein